MTIGQEFNPFRKFTGYFIPECLLPYESISTGAKLCLAVMFRYLGNNEIAWPGQSKLAEKMGVSVRMVGSYLQELEQDGFIRSDRIGLGQTNNYSALWHRIFDEDEGNTTSDPDRKNTSDQEVKETSDQDRKSASDPSIELKRVNRRESSEEDLDENLSTHLDFIRIWSATRGLKRLNGKERSTVQERWRGQITEDALRDALMNFATWVFTATHKIHSPVAVFLKDPLSWLTLRVEPKPLSQTEGYAQVIKEQHSTAVATVPDWKADVLYNEYLAVRLKYTGRVTPKEALAAYSHWPSDPVQQRACIEDMEFIGNRASEPKYILGIEKHLSSEPWTAIRVKPMSDEEAKLEARVARFKAKRAARGVYA